MANTELSNKLASAFRYGSTAVAATFMVLAAFSILSPDQVTALKADIEILKTSVLTGYGALIDMWAILGPVAIIVAGKLGWNSSSVQALAGKLFNIAKNASDPKATEAKVALVNAAASKEIGSQGVVNAELASNPATADNVVSQPAFVPRP